MSAACPPDSELARRLVLEVGRGSAEAEAEIVEHYQERLRFILRRRSDDIDLAEDLVQDCFRIVLERLRRSRLKEPEKLGAYIHGTADSLLTNYHRRSSRRERILGSKKLSTEPEPDEQLEALHRYERVDAVREGILALPLDRDRELLRRFYLFDHDKTEICNALDLTSRQFDLCLYRAKARLRQLLER